MSIHVEDYEIQRYLDNELSGEERIRIQHHIENCEACRQILENYGQLYGVLEYGGGLELPPGFPNRIMEKIGNVGVRHRSNMWKEIFLIFAGLLAGLGITLYFTGIAPFLETIRSTRSPALGLMGSVWNYLKISIDQSELGLIWLITAGIIMLLVNFLDHALMKRNSPA